MATVYHCAVNSRALDNPAQCGHAAELFAASLLRLNQVHTMKFFILQLVTKSGQRLGHEALLQHILTDMGSPILVRYFKWLLKSLGYPITPAHKGYQKPRPSVSPLLGFLSRFQVTVSVLDVLFTETARAWLLSIKVQLTV